jgi:hypothetical protein
MTETSTMTETGSAERTGLPFFRNEYNALLTLLTASLCLAFPIASYAVFGAGADRTRTAEILAIVYVTAMTGLFVAPWLPLPALRGVSNYGRLDRMVVIWILVHTLTALAWEIPWLVLHEQIAGARDELWAYTWWAYIDGGDTRYLEPNWMVFFIEGWADINGILGLVALALWLRSGKTNPLPVYYFMFAAPLHIYPTLLYYVSEIAEGMPNVDTTSFVNLVVKFVLANCFWVILPFFVLVWGKLTLERIYRARYSAS